MSMQFMHPPTRNGAGSESDINDTGSIESVHPVDAQAATSPNPTAPQSRPWLAEDATTIVPTSNGVVYDGQGGTGNGDGAGGDGGVGESADATLTREWQREIAGVNAKPRPSCPTRVCRGIGRAIPYVMARFPIFSLLMCLAGTLYVCSLNFYPEVRPVAISVGTFIEDRHGVVQY